MMSKQDIFLSNINIYMKLINNFLRDKGYSEQIVSKSIVRPSFKLPKGLLKKNILNSGKYPVISQSKEYIIGYSNNEDLLITKDLPLIIFGDHTKVLKYVEEPFIIGADGVKIIKPIDTFLEKFFYYNLLGLTTYTKNYGRHYKLLKEEKIILVRDKVLQQHIVDFLDDLQNNSLKNKIYFNKEIEKNILTLNNRVIKIITFKSEIFTQQTLLKQLRQSILQEAIEGKLTISWREKNPNIESATLLLEKIKAEKERLIKEKKIKKQKALAPIDKSEVPFNIPNGWVWCRLGESVHFITDGVHHTPTYTKSGIHFLSVKDVAHGKIDLSNTRYISEETHKKLIERCNPEFGDLLLTKVGTTGIAKVIDIDEEFSLFVSVALLKFNQNYIFNYFLEHLINSPFVKNQSNEGTKGMGNKNLVIKTINNFIIPLPPLEEQKQIVQKIETLFSLCDKLEEQINTFKKSAEMLMQSVLKEAFGERL